MKPNHCSLPAWCIAMLVFSAPVTAADFTFNVPLQVQNMAAAYTEGKVRCEVARGTANSVIGVGEQFFGLNNLGNFVGTLTVAVNVQQDEDPAAATAWTCQLWFLDASGGYVTADKNSNTDFLVGDYVTTINGTL